MNQTEPRKTITLMIVSILLLMASIALPSLILDGNKVVSLPVGSTFGGQISQYMGIPSDRTELAVEGKDFALDASKFFANKTWAVVHFKSLSDRVPEGGYVIFQQQNGAYTLVEGPSTAFMSTYLKGMPNDLVQYLYSQGTVYEPGL